MDSNNICGTHKRSIDLICYDCNVLMCSICSPKHARHTFDHIENIKSNFNDHDTTQTAPIDDNNTNNNNTNNNSSFTKITDIQTGIQSAFDSLKLKVKEYEQLQQTEHQIESSFKELHEFLIVEEHRLKTPIIDSKDQLEQQIDKQIKIMKSLNTINNHFKVKSNNNNNDDDDDESDRSDSQSLTITDTTDNYQISTIIRSISQSSHHNEFISANINTLFYFDDYPSLDSSYIEKIFGLGISLVGEIENSLSCDEHCIFTNDIGVDQGYEYLGTLFGWWMVRMGIVVFDVFF
ncbi:hypothetical protein PPL_09881 [Heterostelium album PN500]|uniref:B box-type domain-containing protein n=1 Tax=Heterostelium pallidum (strain ATCC 26659 / Pp 5 / PN500) TaxID=670386 RepID=D3BPB6_HETP5|nr:hypothetical protein PPL_09881 [Heterostelium album PN500]EFA77126.1 hypothetical protein PPL_09881 [Heterostelium album PN500]|eukprot:XP_020429255.1 hypothetical protein PPL_09881 [Heterostelium album PN500]